MELPIRPNPTYDVKLPLFCLVGSKAGWSPSGRNRNQPQTNDSLLASVVEQSPTSSAVLRSNLPGDCTHLSLQDFLTVVLLPRRSRAPANL